MTKLQQIILAHLPKENIAKLGSENQEEYLAYENGFNSCLAEIKKALPDIEKAVMEVVETHRFIAWSPHEPALEQISKGSEMTVDAILEELTSLTTENNE